MLAFMYLLRLEPQDNSSSAERPTFKMCRKFGKHAKVSLCVCVLFFGPPLANLYKIFIFDECPPTRGQTCSLLAQIFSVSRSMSHMTDESKSINKLVCGEQLLFLPFCIYANQHESNSRNGWSNAAFYCLCLLTHPFQHWTTKQPFSVWSLSPVPPSFCFLSPSFAFSRFSIFPPPQNLF